MTVPPHHPLREFIAGLPKAELHVHHVGSASPTVVAERMIKWFFLNNNDGRGAAIAVVLFIAVIPVMVWNVKQFRALEANR